jgi:hypothetical protein
MFVRFRQSRNRLQASLIETRRDGRKVRHEHIASFGAVDVPPSIRERLAFWAKLPQRLDRLTNRIDGEAVAKSLTQKPTSPNHRLPLTAFETHNGRSTFAAGTALHAPLTSLAVDDPIGSSGWKLVVPDLPGL